MSASRTAEMLAKEAFSSRFAETGTDCRDAGPASIRMEATRQAAKYSSIMTPDAPGDPSPR
jgi:hypothetical protein